MLVPTILLGFRGFMEKRKAYIVLFFIGGLEILMLGSRMAAVCVVLFLILYLLIISTDSIGSSKEKIFYIFVLVVLGLFLCFLYEQILTLLGEIFERIGFSSRTITRILNGTISNDIARNLLYLQSKDLINSGGMFGYGFLADRFYLGNYCHNIFLELFIEFGYVGGCFAIGILMGVIFRMIFKCEDIVWKGLFLVFFCCTFFRLLVSYSLWIDNNFWMMIGIYRCYVSSLNTDNRYEIRKEENQING